MYYVFQNTYIVFVLYLQNRAVPKRVVSIFDLRVMSSNARGIVTNSIYIIEYHKIDISLHFALLTSSSAKL